MAIQTMKRSRGGFTMVELAVAVTVLAVLLYSLGVVVIQGEGAYQSAKNVVDLESKMGRTMARIVEELNGVGEVVLFPDPDNQFGTDELNFQKAEGVAAGDIVWGPLTRLEFVYADGEVDDGIDNNDDGLIDEGVLQLTRDVGGADEQTIILCKDVAEFTMGETLNGVDDNGNNIVDECGFNVHQAGSTLEVNLTVVGLDGAGRPIERMLTTSVRLRN
jgi:prepilin-type N-terminal cleavage/methylation domain-containing protein